MMSTYFVTPVYLQVVLRLDAFETGKRQLPPSVATLMFALLDPRDRGPAPTEDRHREACSMEAGGPSAAVARFWC
jgi:hypothetical protein